MSRSYNQSGFLDLELSIWPCTVCHLEAFLYSNANLFDSNIINHAYTAIFLVTFTCTLKDLNFIKIFREFRNF